MGNKNETKYISIFANKPQKITQFYHFFLVQGAIIVASLFQLVIGYFGIIGLILRFITPLTIAPAVSMVGLALFEVAGSYAAGHWGIAIGMIVKNDVV